MSSQAISESLVFAGLGLAPAVLSGVEEAGYESPTPIQRQIIPLILDGRDVVGQAQTGTGKTAAFALPFLSRLEPEAGRLPQILVLTPTRELALQVAESFELYGRHLRQFRVAAIFGGQEYASQIRLLQHGVQVVVGTPGRVMDHLRRGTLDASKIKNLVLDEADEMLKMGFLDDVEWILEQLPARQHTALFSATMPPSIRSIAMKYLTGPVEVTIEEKTVSAETINQRYLVTGGFDGKVDALCRILEVEESDGVLVFVRTKVETMELAERLAGLGFSVAPLNGDIQQSHRLRTVEQLKGKKIDILVATDVAARGLDVERISHVVNFDIPFDAEAYIHRIGRTGRAGRSGEAILFVNSREKQMLKVIERATRQKIALMALPTIAEINNKRIDDFKKAIAATLTSDISFYEKLVNEFLDANPGQNPVQVAAALAMMGRRDKPLLLPEPERKPVRPQQARKAMDEAPRRKTTRVAAHAQREDADRVEEGMERYRIEIGASDGIKPGNIVGAIANEADIESRHIGRISIYDYFSTVDLPYGMPKGLLRTLQKARIYGKMMKMQKMIESSQDDKKTSPSPKEQKKAQGRLKPAAGKSAKRPPAAH